MGPSIDVSLCPLYIAVTVAVKGEPATTAAGTLISRMAWDEPQLNDTSPAIATLKARSSPKRAELREDFAKKRRKPEFTLDTNPLRLPRRSDTGVAGEFERDSAHHTGGKRCLQIRGRIF